MLRMDQETIAVDIGDGVPQECQIAYRNDLGLKGVQIADPADGLIETVQAFPPS